MMTETREHNLWWIFRVALAMCFIGHGMFGIVTKEEWIPLFGVLGLSRDTAFALMPIIGAIDIAVGALVLVRPMRSVVLYMAVWALWTASLRPLSGDSVLELLERAGNYGVPLAFLFFLGPASRVRDWITRASVPMLTPEREVLVWRVLMATTVLLLVGHGGLALAQKGALVGHAASVGFSGESVVLAGAIELAMALVVILAPRPTVLLGVAVWKVGTELLYPISGASGGAWEFIERAGSYAAPTALAILAARRSALGLHVRARSGRGVLSRAAAVLLIAALIPGSSQAQRQDAIPVAPAGILDSLRRGGYVLACRHTETNHDQSDRGGRTRDLQRNLSSRGEQQAKEIGAVIRALRIPIGEVRSNPMYRNQETALYAFGRMVVDSTLVGGSALRAMLAAPVRRGTNRAIVVRQGTLGDAMEDHGLSSTSEGDCFVVQPLDARGFRVLGRLRVQDWQRGR